MIETDPEHRRSTMPGTPQEEARAIVRIADATARRMSADDAIAFYDDLADALDCAAGALREDYDQ